MDYGLMKMDEMDYGLKEMNDTMTKAEVMWSWVMMAWWNLTVMKSITEQRDDQNPNLQSMFLLGISGVHDLRLSVLHFYYKKLFAKINHITIQLWYKCTYCKYSDIIYEYRSSHPEVFLGKGVLKICSKFTGKHPCRITISIKL